MIHEIKIEIDTIKTKAELLSLFCDGAGYKKDVENPPTKAEFAKKVLAQYFLSMVRKGRQEAKDKIAQEEVELELSAMKTI